MKRWSSFVAVLGFALGASVAAQHQAEHRAMVLVGHDDLQAL